MTTRQKAAAHEWKIFQLVQVGTLHKSDIVKSSKKWKRCKTLEKYYSLLHSTFVMIVLLDQNLNEVASPGDFIKKFGN